MSPRTVEYSHATARDHADRCEGSVWLTYEDVERIDGRKHATEVGICEQCGERQHRGRVAL
jgi:hypothetical protein